MKILHTVESYLPQRHGMSEVVKRISEKLVERGHEVTIATSWDDKRDFNTLNGVKIKPFKISGSLVRGLSGEVGRFENYLLNSDFDVVTNFAAQQWATDICLPLLSQMKCKKIFVPTGFSGLSNSIFHSYFNKMKGWIHEYDSTIFLSKNYQDYIFAESAGLNQRKIEVIPNGADEIEFMSDKQFSIREHFDIDQSQKIVLHVGSNTGLKGHKQALDIFLRSKNENTYLIFVGENFHESRSIKLNDRSTPLKSLRAIFSAKECVRQFSCYLENTVSFSDNIIQERRDKINDRLFPLKKATTSFNPIRWIKLIYWHVKLTLSGKKDRIKLIKLKRQNLVDTYKEADLFLFPSMIECSPVVLFEALASKTPFLASDVGNSVEIADNSKAGIILPTQKDAKGYSHVVVGQSALILDELIGNQSELERMAHMGHKSWKENYTWKGIALKYEKLYIDSLQA